MKLKVAHRSCKAATDTGAADLVETHAQLLPVKLYLFLRSFVQSYQSYRTNVEVIVNLLGATRENASVALQQ